MPESFNLPAGDVVSVGTNQDWTGRQFTCCQLSGNVVVYSTAGQNPWGIMQNTPVGPKEMANVIREGQSKGLLAATVAQFDVLGPDANGHLIANTLGNVIAQEAGSSGDLIDVVIEEPGSLATGNEIQVGFVTMFAGAVAPAGYLLCDGAAVSQATYPALFALIAHTYGPDPGGGDFLLPDLRGRLALGVGTGAGLTARALADTGGQEAITDVPAHVHSIEPASFNNVGDADIPNENAVHAIHEAVGEDYSTATPNIHMKPYDSESTGVASVDVMAPFLALTHIIKAK